MPPSRAALPGLDERSTAIHHERERTWSPGDTDLPDLTALAGVAGVGKPPAQELVATYLDTADLTLVRAGISLRRRTGGTDAGWHLKLPSDDGNGEGRDEVQLPLGGDHLAPPDELVSMVEDHVRARDLVPVAEIRTRRVVHDLCSSDGRVLAELADDRVEAQALPAGADPVVWREWEVELVDGDPALLRSAHEVFARLGVHPSAASRKIEIALGDRLAAQLSVQAGIGAGAVSAKGPAREVLRARLVEQSAALLRHDAGMRGDAPDSVHQARVACRRLRAALATYRPLVDRQVTDPLRHELRWVARSLGDVRDAEVARELLAGLLGEQPRSLRRGPVKRRLERTFAPARRQGRRTAEELLDSERYRALLEDLERLVADPPWTEAAEARADAVLLPRVRKDVKRLRRRVDAAAERRAHDEGGLDEAVAYDAALHEVRKAAKRLRYACEALEPVWSEDAKALRKAAKGITQVLGDRQDTTVSRQRLRALVADAEDAGESGFTWGRLHGLEEARAADRERQFWESSWLAVRRKKLRRWLKR